MRLIKAIQRALLPDLLCPKWRAKVRPGDHPTTGHCYIGAEALFHIWGKKRGFKPYVISLPNDETHWFLKHSSGRIADPTAEQWGGEPIPYDRGRACAFLTTKPSKRARVVMERVLTSVR